MDSEMRRLAVTFYSRHENPAYEPYKCWKLGPSEPTDGQKALSTDFASTLENLTGVHLSSSDVQGIDFPLHRMSFGYGQGVFQTFFPLPDELDLKSIRDHSLFKKFEATHQLELVLDLYPFQPSPQISSQSYRPFKLALFDMDSTLINEEVIDELARSIGVYDRVSAITSQAMNDPTLDFAASLKARVALLKGVPANIWSSLQKKVTIAPGAKELIAGLRSSGIVTGVISGGFAPMAEWLKGELGLDLAFANHLSISAPTAQYDYPHLTGELDLSDGKVIVTPEYKKATLIFEARKREIPLEQTLAAGDGSNDLKMLGAAGLGIAWNAKPRTQEMAPMRLNGTSLAELLFLLGPAGARD